MSAEAARGRQHRGFLGFLGPLMEAGFTLTITPALRPEYFLVGEPPPTFCGPK
jgi:hypothetical protein